MKYKKKILSVICLLLVCILVSCQSKERGSETDTTAAPLPETLILFGGEDDFRIVYSDGAGNALRQAVTDLKSAVKEATGKNPTVVTDTNAKKTAVANEVLIGNTTREESKTVLSAVGGTGWKICVQSGKLVVHGSDDEQVIQALENLRTLWQNADGKITIASSVSESRDNSANRIPLFANGKFRYRIVYSASVSQDVEKAIANLELKLERATGSAVEKVYDSTPENGSCEILIGQTNRAASAHFYESLESQFLYRATATADGFLVGALSENALLLGIGDLTDALAGAIQNCYNGNPTVPGDFLLTGSTSETATALPAMKAGTFKGIYDEGNNSNVLYYTNVTAQDYADYCEALIGDGCTAVKEYAMTDNRYTLFTNESYTAYVSWLPKVGAIRVYVGKANVKYPTISEATAAGDETPTLWQLEVATKEARSNGGMSYVVKLSDGTFLIVDGGFNYNEEGDRLYQLLRENTPEGQKPVVTAWFITHLHGDHYGGMQSLANRYSDKVDVKAFYYNFPEVAVGTQQVIASGVSRTVETSMNQWKSAVRYSKLHSGMVLGFAGATVTVLATHEDVYPLSIVDGNDTCTVIRLDIAGQRILFLGDAYFNEESAILTTVSNDALKCDIVQVSHHGYEGCSNQLYQKTGATVALWPMNIDGYQDTGYSNVPQIVFGEWYNKSLSGNRYIRTSSSIVKILVSGAGTVKLTLPYDPSTQTVYYVDSYGVTREASGRLIDYGKVYTDRTS